MAGSAHVSRRGRKESTIDPEAPSHRREFAQRLRALRTECLSPSYRLLAGLSHCGAGTLSEAAGGRRFPSWDVTRAYVTGCLLHARRAAETDRLLVLWHAAWAEASAQERAHRRWAEQRRAGLQPPTAPGRTEPPCAEPPAERGAAAPVGTAPARAEMPRAERVGAEPGGAGRSLVGAASGGSGASGVEGGRRPGPRVRAMTGAAVLALLLTMVGTSAPSAPRMSGAFNVAVAPFAWFGSAARPIAGRLQAAVARELTAWSRRQAGVEVRGPSRVHGHGDDDRGRALRAVVRDSGADAVVSASVRTDEGATTVALEVYLTGRVVGETPELAGLHDIVLTQAADVFGHDVWPDHELAEAGEHYVRAVMEFVRGLGAYALDQLDGAEAGFLAAERGFEMVDEAVGRRTVRPDLLHLLLGDTVGRADVRRLDQATDHLRLAYAQNADYARTRIGLADAVRAAAGCRPGRTEARPLHEALEHYRAALALGAAREEPTATFVRMRAHLGAGLTLQCLAAAGLDDRWADADAEFREVLRLRTTIRPDGAGEWQALRLAAEARAGQARTAHMTAPTPECPAGPCTAAVGYEAALGLLGRIADPRPADVERELAHLRGLRAVYHEMGAAPQVEEVERRIAAAGDRLAALRVPRIE